MTHDGEVLISISYKTRQRRSAQSTSMEIVFDEFKNPEKVKRRKYPARQRKFQKVYIEKLVEMGFL